MASYRETVEILDKLIELTQHNEISWNGVEPSYNLKNSDVRLDLIYTTKYLNKNIRLYKQEYKYFVDEEQYHWQNRMIFEFIDEAGNVLWEFPQTNNAWDLLNAVQYKNSQVDDFYKNLFGK